jgi:hypothetical protein
VRRGSGWSGDLASTREGSAGGVASRNRKETMARTTQSGTATVRLVLVTSEDPDWLAADIQSGPSHSRVAHVMLKRSRQ